MKKILSLLAISVIALTMPAYAGHGEETETESSVEAHNIQRDVVISVDGMVCDFCAQSIKKVFGKQEAVENIDVDLDNGEIVVDIKDGQALDHAVIEKLVVDSGYTIRDIKHTE